MLNRNASQEREAFLFLEGKEPECQTRMTRDIKDKNLSDMQSVKELLLETFHF